MRLIRWFGTTFPAWFGRANDVGLSATNKPCVLVLVQEVGKSFDRSTDLALADQIAKWVDIVIIAPSYDRNVKALQRQKHAFRTYGFGPARFEEEVKAFATDLLVQFHPRFVIVIGGGNAALVAVLDLLGIAVVSLVQHGPHTPSEDGELYVIFRHAMSIRFSYPSSLQGLRKCSSSLAARTYVCCSGHEGSLLDNASLARIIIDVGDASSEENSLRNSRAALDAKIIDASGRFSSDLALPLKTSVKDADAISYYLRASSHAVPRSNPHAGRLVRRPTAGFHPFIYATEASGFIEADGIDPFTHFLNMGSPPGRWAHKVLDHRNRVVGGQAPKSAVHLHLHYPDLLDEFLEHFSHGSPTDTDLIITTTSQEKGAEIQTYLARYGRKADVRIYPNRGRDIWPLIDLLQSGLLDDYEVVGHFHGKRSTHYELGNVWRLFLWEHLLGGLHPMSQVIGEAFKADEHLGLVFAEEPHLDGWDENKAGAEALAARMALPAPLPTHLEYPVGTMFWARPGALRPLLALNWSEKDVPKEPLPNDGTDLHAIECLLVFIVEAAGFTYATTHIPGIKR